MIDALQFARDAYGGQQCARDTRILSLCLVTVVIDVYV